MALLDMYKAGNSRFTLLSENISTAAQSVKVDDLSFFPDGPNYATIGVENDHEVIFYAGKDEGTGSLTGCLRGQSGTISKSWDAGQQVYHAFTSQLANNIIENIQSIDLNKQDKLIPGTDYVSPNGDGKWYPIPLISGAVADATNPPKYKKENGVLFLTGRLSSCPNTALIKIAEIPHELDANNIPFWTYFSNYFVAYSVTGKTTIHVLSIGTGEIHLTQNLPVKKGS